MESSADNRKNTIISKRKLFCKVVSMLSEPNIESPANVDGKACFN